MTRMKGTLNSWVLGALLCCSWIFPMVWPITVTVNSEEDSWPIDTAFCLSSAASSKRCNLRNALLFCAKSDEFVESECVIQLPTAHTLQWNVTKGPVTINTVPEDVMITFLGNNSVIALTSSDALSSFLQIKMQDNSIVRVDVQNATFTNFTDGVFTLEGLGKVTISDSLFLNNNGGKGGSIAVHQIDNMEVLNCRFIGNSGVLGGALFMESTVNDLNISNTQFTSNSATKGGAILALSGNIGLTLEHTSFTRNTALEAGGALFMGSFNSYWTMSFCTFSNNSVSDGSGGAVTLDSTDNNYFTVSDSLFSQNAALLGRGGGLNIYSDSTSITFQNVSFVSNLASKGGAVFLHSDVQLVTVSDSGFLFNSATLGDGGAINCGSYTVSMNITGCLFESNEALGKGGALNFGLFNTVIRVNNTNFVSNRAGDGGGIAIDAFSTVWIDHSSFTSNSVCATDNVCDADAESSGGAVYYFGVLREENTLTIQRTDFQQNTAYAGSALGLYGNGVTLYGCTFSDNTATADAVVDIRVAENIEISDCVFHSHNLSVLRIVSSIRVVLKNCEVSSTNSTLSAFNLVMAQVVTIENSLFSDNYNAESGGALYLDSCRSVNILNTTFLANSVLSSGGAMYIEDCTDVTVSQSFFENNIAYAGASLDDYNSGGAAFVLGSLLVTFEANSFLNNIAGSTVGIGSTGSEQTSMYNSGGALFMRSSNMLTIADNLFSNNSAGSIVGLLFNSGGGLFSEDNDKVTIDNNVFFKNRAGTSSGGEYNSGGGLFVTSTTSLSVERNTFEECTALYGGGGGVLYVASSGVSVDASRNDFINNSALYGNDIATDAYALELDDTPPPYLLDLDTFSEQRSYSVRVVDLYGHTVSNQDALVTATASFSHCGPSLVGYIAGQTTANLIAGVGNLFFLASCYPDSVLNLDIAAFEPSHLDSLTVRMKFRGCRRGEYYSSGGCWECPNGTFSLESNADLSVTSCQTCPSKATCYGSVIDVEAGYWRQAENSSNLIDCPIPGGCIGGVQTGDELCEVGYSGVLCGACQSGYFYEFLSDSCTECTESSLSVTAILALVLCGIGAALLFAWMCGKRLARFVGKQMGVSWFYSKFGRQKSQTLEVRKEKLIKSEDYSLKIRSKMKQVVTFYQIVSSFPSILSMTLPPIYYHLTYIFSFINVGVFVKDLGLTCSYESLDYVSIVIGSTLGPIVVCMVLYIVQYCHVYLTFNMYSEAFRDIANTENRIIVLKSTYFHVFLAFTYLILPGVTTILFGMLKPCVDVDPQDSVTGEDLYLEADYNLKCDTSRYRLGVIWAAVFMFVYPVGIPFMYFCLLYKDRHTLRGRANTDVAQLDEKGLHSLEAAAIRLSSISFLSQEYQPEYWYFEIVETYRKLFLTSVLSVISPGSTLQLVVGELFCVFSLILYVVLNPFRDTEMTRTSSICQVQIWYILFVLILINEDVNMPGYFNTVSIVISLLIVMIYVILWTLFEFFPLPKRIHNVLKMIYLPETAASRRDRKRRSSISGGGSDECVDRAIAVLSLPDPVIDQLRVHETDSHSLRVGKMRNHIFRLGKRRKIIQRQIRKLEKLGFALLAREQNISDDICEVQSKVDALKDDTDDVDIYSLELKRHDIRYGQDFPHAESSDDSESEGGLDFDAEMEMEEEEKMKEGGQNDGSEKDEMRGASAATTITISAQPLMSEGEGVQALSKKGGRQGESENNDVTAVARGDNGDTAIV